jgi:hypothetical protein
MSKVHVLFQGMASTAPPKFQPNASDVPGHLCFWNDAPKAASTPSPLHPKIDSAIASDQKTPHIHPKKV